MPFYGVLIPGIKSILSQAVSPELSVFRGKTMECVGLMADAVGPAVFAADATEIMQILMQALVNAFPVLYLCTSLKFIVLLYMCVLVSRC